MGKKGLSGKGDMALNQAPGPRLPGRGLGKSSSLTEITPVNPPSKPLRSMGIACSFYRQDAEAEMLRDPLKAMQLSGGAGIRTQGARLQSPLRTHTLYCPRCFPC